MKAVILIFLPLILLLSCQSNSSKQNISGTTEQYAYITNITENTDSTFITANCVQYLTGDSAIEAAKKEHQADTTVIDGKTHIDVPDNYYISDENKKIRRLKLSKQIVFDLLLDLDRVDPAKKIKDNSLISFRKIYKDNLFLLSISNNEVVKIKEIFLP